MRRLSNLGFRRAPRSPARTAALTFTDRGRLRDTSIVVQCKAWDAYRVGIKAARELRGRWPRHRCEGALVTSGRFTQEAVDSRARENISSVDGADLLAKIRALPEKRSRFSSSPPRGLPDPEPARAAPSR